MARRSFAWPSIRHTLLLSAILLLVLVWPDAARAQGTLQPVLNCIDYDPATSMVRAYFGYVSTYDTDITVPISPGNFFTPGDPNRGQPTVFHPGYHPRAHVTAFAPSTALPQLFWLLQDNASRVALDDLRLYCGQPNYRGDWSPSESYHPGDLVRHDSIMWVYTRGGFCAPPAPLTPCVWRVWAPNPPSIDDLVADPIPVYTTVEDTPLPPIPFTVADPDHIGDLRLSAVSSDPTIVPTDGITLAGWGANRTVTVAPHANRSGSARITVSVTDGATAPVSMAFDVVVLPANDAPAISAVPDWIVDEDTAAPALTFTVGDLETAAGALVVTGHSSNQALVPDTPDAIAIEGTGGVRTVRITPAADEHGTTTITLSVSDGTVASVATFRLTVRSVDDRPAIAGPADRTMTAGAAPIAQEFSVGDRDSSVESLMLFGSSSNAALVPPGGIVFGGSGAMRTIAVTPAPEQTGAATITVTVSDGNSVASASFVLTVVAGPVPLPPLTYYLAEGATGAFFDLDVLLANPHATPVPVTIEFMTEQGGTIAQPRTLPPTSRTTIRVDEIPGLAAAAVSTRVTSPADRPILVERTMWWDEAGYGAHTERATAGAALTWFFAEGAQGNFATFLLLANPDPEANAARVTYFREGGAPVVRDYPLLPASRYTIDASQDPELVDWAFGARVEFERPGVAERAMYFGRSPLFAGGHESAGAVMPARRWFLAEGATGSFFTTFVLLANPGDTDATVTLTYLPASGTPVMRTFVLGAHQRSTRNIAIEAPSLASAAVATQVESTEPIVVERTQYWPNPGWYEAHNSFGVTETGTRWGLAEGRVGGPRHDQTYVLLANPGDEPANVTLTFLREDGSTVQTAVLVPASSRHNVALVSNGGDVPALGDGAFGTVIESSRPIAVERSMYSDANGIIWSAGTNATAIPIP